MDIKEKYKVVDSEDRDVKIPDDMKVMLDKLVEEKRLTILKIES